MFQCSKCSVNFWGVGKLCEGLVSHYRGGRVRRCIFFIWNIRNIRNIVIKSMTYFCTLWNFLWNIRNITMEHYKNKASAYMSCRKAAQRTGIDIVVSHYLTYWVVNVPVHKHTRRCTHEVTMCRKADQRTGIIMVVCHYTYWQVSQQSRKLCVAKLIRELV